MKQFVSQDPRSNSSYFDLKIWFRARNVTGTFEKRAPGSLFMFEQSENIERFHVNKVSGVEVSYWKVPFQRSVQSKFSSLSNWFVRWYVNVAKNPWKIGEKIIKEKRKKRQSVRELKSGHHELGEWFDSKGHYALHDALIQGARVVRALCNWFIS